MDNKFYNSGLGNKLIDYNNYPLSIKKYLAEENRILQEYLIDNEILVEVGCMVARNLQLALNLNKKYVGIDIAENYIDAANNFILENKLMYLCEVHNIDAETLLELNNYSKMLTTGKPLFYFPFNSFGNMKNHNNVLRNFKHFENANFLIFSYLTTENATAEREAYYVNCNYSNLKKIQSEQGITFKADEGLCTMAFHLGYMYKIANEENLKISHKIFSDIGIVYLLSNYILSSE